MLTHFLYCQFMEAFRLGVLGAGAAQHAVKDFDVVHARVPILVPHMEEDGALERMYSHRDVP